MIHWVVARASCQVLAQPLGEVLHVADAHMTHEFSTAQLGAPAAAACATLRATSGAPLGGLFVLRAHGAPPPDAALQANLLRLARVASTLLELRATQCAADEASSSAQDKPRTPLVLRMVRARLRCMRCCCALVRSNPP